MFDAGALPPDRYNHILRTALDKMSTARDQGLLALDADTKDMTLNPVFREGLEMVVNGADPAVVKTRLTEMVRTLAGDPQAVAEGVFYLMCVLSLQQGESDAMLKLRLASLSGIDQLEKALEEF